MLGEEALPLRLLLLLLHMLLCLCPAAEVGDSSSSSELGVLRLSREGNINKPLLRRHQGLLKQEEGEEEEEEEEEGMLIINQHNQRARALGLGHHHCKQSFERRTPLAPYRL